MENSNEPDIIVTLVARTHRAGEVWAHPHNESFYIPPLCQANSGVPREVEVSKDSVFRAVTPDEEIEPSEPALQITFSRRPKNPRLGYSARYIEPGQCPTAEQWQ